MHISPILPAARTNVRVDIRALLPAALAAMLAVAIASINPVGYVGGGSDDWQYLEAARCAAAQGFCIPDTHWAARLPHVFPTAAVLSLLGESRAHLMLMPIACGLAAIGLFVAVVQRAAGRTAAALAGAALATAPMVGGELTALNVSTVEFFLAWPPPLRGNERFSIVADGRHWRAPRWAWRFSAAQPRSPSCRSAGWR